MPVDNNQELRAGAVSGLVHHQWEHISGQQELAAEQAAEQAVAGLWISFSDQ